MATVNFNLNVWNRLKLICILHLSIVSFLLSLFLCWISRISYYFTHYMEMGEIQVFEYGLIFTFKFLVFQLSANYDKSEFFAIIYGFTYQFKARMI